MRADRGLCAATSRQKNARQNSIAKEFALEGEEQKAVLVWANLDLFARGLEIDAGTKESSWRVTRLGSQCQIRSHWKAKAFWCSPDTPCYPEPGEVLCFRQRPQFCNGDIQGPFKSIKI